MGYLRNPSAYSMSMSDFIVAQPEEPKTLRITSNEDSSWSLGICSGIRNAFRGRTFFYRGDWYKGYFSLLLLFPKTIYVVILAGCFTVGITGLLRRNHVKDMHDLYTMRGSEEMTNYQRTSDIWNDRLSDLHIILEASDPTQKVWSLKALHYGGWLDATVRHLQVNRNRLRDMASMTSMGDLQKQADM